MRKRLRKKGFILSQKRREEKKTFSNLFLSLSPSLLLSFLSTHLHTHTHIHSRSSSCSISSLLLSSSASSSLIQGTSVQRFSIDHTTSRRTSTAAAAVTTTTKELYSLSESRRKGGKAGGTQWLTLTLTHPHRSKEVSGDSECDPLSLIRCIITWRREQLLSFLFAVHLSPSQATTTFLLFDSTAATAAHRGFPHHLLSSSSSSSTLLVSILGDCVARVRKQCLQPR